MGSCNISNRINEVNKALKDLLAMVWDFKTILNNHQGLSTIQVTLCRCFACTTIEKYFRSWHNCGWEILWFHNPLQLHYVAHTFGRKKWQTFPPCWEPDSTRAAPMEAPQHSLRSPGPAWCQRNTVRNKQGKEKTLSSPLPKKGYFRGITPKHVAGQAFILSNISILLPSKPGFWSAT